MLANLTKPLVALLLFVGLGLGPGACRTDPLGANIWAYCRHQACPQPAPAAVAL